MSLQNKLNEIGLENVRNELINIENELIELLEKRVRLGVSVAIFKYPNIKDKIDDDNILELIEDKNVEQKVIDRIRSKCSDPRLELNMVRLYQEYLIPRNKEIQIEYIKDLNK